ncbi:MAG TPA: SBBP repeat-containing protein, partial [Terriglobia bacterium]|nr:SBBP repeat-containing protein [Terriglobia bacterium]
MAKVKNPGAEIGNQKLMSGNSKLAARRPALITAARAGQQKIDNPPRTMDSVLRMKLVGANARAAVIGADELPGKSNYFIGNDPKKWRTNVPNYAQVRFQDVYPGVDLVYYGNQGGQLEYDFVVAPGADPNAIALDVGAGLVPTRSGRPRGAPLRIAADGDLVVRTNGGEVRFQKPVVYQVEQQIDSLSHRVIESLKEKEPSNGSVARSLNGAIIINHQSPTTNHQFLVGHYVLSAGSRVSFAVGAYDKTRPLIIDPVLSYSTYLGGGGDSGNSIAVDSGGNAYITGVAQPTHFPTTPGAFQTVPGGLNDAFVIKLNAAGSALVYSTYLGGSGQDQGTGIAVDSTGNAYVTGWTQSVNFPTASPLQGAIGGPSATNAFVTKLNATGNALVYSTYLGGVGVDEAAGIALDLAGNAYIMGQTDSLNFPLASSLQARFGGGSSDAFVTKLNTSGSALVYSTYLGGNSLDEASAIAIDSVGNAYITGWTQSTNFPTASPFQPALGVPGAVNAFVTKLNAAGSALVYSTYLGGNNNDYARGIAVDSADNAYVTGFTTSTNFPIASPFQPSIVGLQAPFVTKLNATGSALVYSTYLGGSNFGDQGLGIAVDSAGNAYVTGFTASATFPTASPIQAGLIDGQNAFVTNFNAAGSALVYSTYLGGSGGDMGNGIALDSAGNAYLTGFTRSADFPITPGAYQTSLIAFSGAFVAKIAPGAAASAVSLSAPSLTFGAQNDNTTSAPQTETVTNTGTANLSISTVTLGGANAGDFATSADTCTGATVTPARTCTVGVTFTPSAAGIRSASLIFTDNAANSPQSAGLMGTGVSAIPLAGVSPASLAFGNQNLSTTSASQPVTLSNTGTGTLTITSFATSANFGETNNCGGKVAASASCTINVTFSPTAVSLVTGTLVITENSNGVAGSTQTVTLSGTGTAPVANLSAPSLSFGNQPLTTSSAAQTETVTNTGTANLSISTVTVGGTNAGDFAKSADTCTGATVAPNGTCTVNLTFTPAAKGAGGGTLT